MKFRYYIVIFFLGSLFCRVQSVCAQTDENLYFYGYFQAISRYSHIESNPVPEVGKAWSFSIQQMNLFMFKQLDRQFSTFINLEITNSLSTEEGWGGLALDEAWVKYDRSRGFKVKAGLLVPTFNNLNAIRDKTPLLPYIIRPFAYETLVSDFLSTDELVPLQAAIEVYGGINLGHKAKLDYAAYIGNNAASMISEAVTTLPSGSDSTLAKLVGGRVGVRWGNFKLGFSGSYDQADLSRIPIFTEDFTGVGTLPRSRFGIDFFASFPMFYVEAEFIHVFYGLNREKRARLAALSSTNFLFNEALDKLFGYVTVGADFGDSWFTYGMFSYIEDRSNIVTEDGFGMYSFGGGYRLNDMLILKAQLVHTATYTDTLFFARETDVLVGLSVFL